MNTKLTLAEADQWDEFAPKELIQLPESQDAYSIIGNKLKELECDTTPVYVGYGLEVYTGKKCKQVVVDFDSYTLKVK